MEKHCGNAKGNIIFFNDILKNKSKFVCINSMNNSFKEIFPEVMNKILL